MVRRKAFKKSIPCLSYAISLFLYYTGLLRVIILLRRNIFKKYRSVILVYHSISSTNPHYKKNQEYMIPKVTFERQINYLKKKYRVISLKEFVENLKKNNNMTSDYIAITFDDGYIDNFLEAVPVLKKHNMPAIFFLVLGFIGKRYYLNWNEILKMQNDGFEFGYHTLSHPYLTKLSDDEARQEILVSKVMLEDKLGTKIRYFAYPYGDFNEQIVQIVKDAGYEAAVAVIDGPCNPNTDSFLLNRKIIFNRPFYFFAVKIEGLFENCFFPWLRKKLWP